MTSVELAQRKNEIVAVTFDLIARDGIEGATMRRVATAAGATTGRVTHHFSSRIDLLVAALAEVDRRRLQRIAGHVGLEPAEQLKATLLELLPLDTARLDEQLVCVSLRTTGIPELRDEARRQTAERDRLIGMLVKNTRGGTTDETTTVFSLIALVDGLADRLMLDTHPRTRRTAQHALDSALRSGRMAG